MDARLEISNEGQQKKTIARSNRGVLQDINILGSAPLGDLREAALAVTITYGLTELAAAVIGGLIWAALTLASGHQS